MRRLLPLLTLVIVGCASQQASIEPAAMTCADIDAASDDERARFAIWYATTRDGDPTAARTDPAETSQKLANVCSELPAGTVLAEYMDEAFAQMLEDVADALDG